MKISKYNHFVKRNNVVLGFNSRIVSMIILSVPLYEFYNKNKTDIEQIKNGKPELFNIFLSNGFIIDDHVDELNEIRLANKLDTIASKEYHLTLIPSLDCNLKCWYCFENHKSGTKLSPKVTSNIIKHIEAKIEVGECSNLIMDWFGGEPLLNFNDQVYPLSLKLMKLLQKKDMNLHSFFITNGSLIKDIDIEKFREINSRFQITLDGNRKKHDKIRFTKSMNEGTYDELVNTIHKLADNLENTFINIRVNYDNSTLEGFKDILEDFKIINKRKVKFHLERIWQTKPIPGNKLLYTALNDALRMGFSVTYLNFFRKNYSCKSDRLNQATILYDGTVYKCSGRDFTGSFQEGSLSDDGTIKWDSNKISHRIGLSTFENQKCLNCSFLPLCMGPCSQKMIEHNWSNIDEICKLNNMELSLDDYLIYLYNHNENVKKNATF